MFTRILAVLTILAVLLVVTPQPGSAQESEVNLAAVKKFTVENVMIMKMGSATYRALAERYYTRVMQAAEENPGADPYEYLWAEHPLEMTALLDSAKEAWITTSRHYELIEGIVAGVPSLAYYDAWIDAGPPAADDPEGAVAWTLVLADGTELDSPGNFFHNLTEPALFGTNPDFVALEIDKDGDGLIELSEVMPEAELMLATAQGLDMATDELVAAVMDWDPTLSDAFTAQVVMVPTMNEYFEQWKLSAFISGEDFQEEGFVAVSRLFDITGILTGLDVTYENVRPVVREADPDLDAQIDAGFEDLRAYVETLFIQEQEGERFSAEEADLLGTEAQDRATALAGQISQAAALANIELQADTDMTTPAEPPVIEAMVP